MSKQLNNKPELNKVEADSSLWSEESQRSYAAHYTKIYKDKEYCCWRCQKKSVFTAADQKYTYEVRKAYFWQQRILCEECWKEKNNIIFETKRYENQWAKSKKMLCQDLVFLQNWLNLLLRLEEYVPYKPNIAIKNMLTKLIEKNA